MNGWGKLIKLLIVSSISTLSTVGQVFTISSIVLEPTLRRKGNSLIVSQCLSDMLVTCFVLPSIAISLIANYNSSTELCQFSTFQYSMTTMSIMSSLMFSTCIQIENIFFIRRNKRNKKNKIMNRENVDNQSQSGGRRRRNSNFVAWTNLFIWVGSLAIFITQIYTNPQIYKQICSYYSDLDSNFNYTNNNNNHNHHFLTNFSHNNNNNFSSNISRNNNHIFQDSQSSEKYNQYKEDLLSLSSSNPSLSGAGSGATSGNKRENYYNKGASRKRTSTTTTTTTATPGSNSNRNSTKSMLDKWWSASTRNLLKSYKISNLIETSMYVCMGISFLFNIFIVKNLCMASLDEHCTDQCRLNLINNLFRITSDLIFFLFNLLASSKSKNKFFNLIVLMNLPCYISPLFNCTFNRLYRKNYASLFLYCCFKYSFEDGGLINKSYGGGGMKKNNDVRVHILQGHESSSSQSPCGFAKFKINRSSDMGEYKNVSQL